MLIKQLCYCKDGGGGGVILAVGKHDMVFAHAALGLSVGKYNGETTFASGLAIVTRDARATAHMQPIINPTAIADAPAVAAVLVKMGVQPAQAGTLRAIRADEIEVETPEEASALGKLLATCGVAALDEAGRVQIFLLDKGVLQGDIQQVMRLNGAKVHFGESNQRDRYGAWQRVDALGLGCAPDSEKLIAARHVKWRSDGKFTTYYFYPHTYGSSNPRSTLVLPSRRQQPSDPCASPRVKARPPSGWTSLLAPTRSWRAARPASASAPWATASPTASWSLRVRP